MRAVSDRAQSDFSQQFADTLDFWWMYLLPDGRRFTNDRASVARVSAGCDRRAWPSLSATDGDRDMTSRRRLCAPRPADRIGRLAAAARHRLRSPRRLQPGRSVDHVAGAGVCVGRSESAQFPLSDLVLLLCSSPGLVPTSSPHGSVGAIPSVTAFQQSFFLNPTGIYRRGPCADGAVRSRRHHGVWRIGSRMWSGSARPRRRILSRRRAICRPRRALREARCPDDSGAGRSVPGDGLALGVGPRQPVATCVGRRGFGRDRHVDALLRRVHRPATCNRRVGGLAGGTRAPRLRRIAKAGAIAALAFFLGSPFLLAEPLTAIRDLRANRQIVIDRAVESASRWFPSAGDYGRMLAVDASGWPIALLAVIGVVALSRSTARAWYGCWLSFPHRVPAVHQQHRGGDPLRERGAAVCRDRRGHRVSAAWRVRSPTHARGRWP